MLSYQHEYHCGNHGDVLKHAALTLIIEALQRKAAPLRIVDAHAGAGRYDLRSPQARLNAEFQSGIAPLLTAGDPPAELAGYLASVRELNPDGALAYYPGSPQIARDRLRADDQLELLELHPGALQSLRGHFGRDRQVHIHGRDSFEGLPALLPPAERRGLVLIDPSYESKDEFARVAKLLRACHGRWSGGCYLIWYPLLAKRESRGFAARVAATGIRRIYQAELRLGPAAGAGLAGSGLLIVNLPFELDAVFARLMPWLARTLAPGGGHGAAWLVPE